MRPGSGAWLQLCAFSTWAAAASAVEVPEQCAGIPVSHWVSSEWKAKGYHVLCIADQSCSEAGKDDGTCQATGSLSSVGCWSGHRDNCEDLSLAEAPASLFEFETAIIKQAKLQNPTRYKRIKKAKEKKSKFGGLFTFFKVESTDTTPTPIKDPKELSGLVLAFEGGSFVWPGVAQDFRRNITVKDGPDAGLTLELFTRSLKPLVVEVSSFFTEPECQHIIDKASPHIAKSAVSHMDHDVGKPDTNWRSSSTHFLRSDDDLLKRLDARVAWLTATKVTHQEYSQVLRYENGERYAAHHDYFDPNMYAKNEQIQQMTVKGTFNRLATVFFYLTTVEEGGHTNFPRSGGRAQPRDFEDCSHGISIDPVQGRIIIFYSQDPAANLDEFSLHGGCAVEKGVKWSANKWIWNKPMNFLS